MASYEQVQVEQVLSVIARTIIEPTGTLIRSFCRRARTFQGSCQQGCRESPSYLSSPAAIICQASLISMIEFYLNPVEEELSALYIEIVC
jgi:hypothetical protein